MIENKRFKFNVNKYTIEKDKKFFAYLNVVDAHRIINELNIFNDENEQLKLDIIAIEKRADKVYDENEQLKQRNKELEEKLDCIWDSYENYYGMSITNAEWYGFKSDVE